MSLDMGKYALYVWGAYGVSFVLLMALVLGSLRAQNQAKEQLAYLESPDTDHES